MISSIQYKHFDVLNGGVLDCPFSLEWVGAFGSSKLMLLLHGVDCLIFQGTITGFFSYFVHSMSSKLSEESVSSCSSTSFCRILGCVSCCCHNLPVSL